MGIFDGVGDAEIFERGKFIKGGFRGVLRATRTIAKETRKSGTGFIVEFEVIESNLLEDHPVGAKCTWFQKMADKDVAFPAIKAWAAAMGGLRTDQKEEIAQEVAPHLADMLQDACDEPGLNDFVGCMVRVETEMIKTAKKGLDFTVHNWSPYFPPAETAE